MRGKGNLVPLERLVLARALCGQAAAVASLARITASGSDAAGHLQRVAAALQNVTRECARAGERFEESRRFRSECEAAAQLDSVEDMIRRRDELLARHQRRRKTP
ncbi:MAG: hypothetical protein EXR02_07700 [Rhodospirillales bacterium]|nr:hypothetical protein [Rhodospirillales bacterium]MSP80927.1 hypothetical protein [Rhodospirillales bacterium]